MEASSYFMWILISGTVAIPLTTFEKAVRLATCHIECPEVCSKGKLIFSNTVFGLLNIESALQRLNRMNLEMASVQQPFILVSKANLVGTERAKNLWMEHIVRCQKRCFNTKRAVKYLEVEAEANATFVCRDVQYVVLKHNPGTFVIEHRPVNGSWEGALATSGSTTTFRELWPGEIYKFRIRRVSADGVSEPEITDPIETMTGLKDPEKVTNISVDSIEVDAENPFRMKSEISFTPSEDLSCFYEVLLWNRVNRNQLVVLKNPVKFESVFTDLEFNMEYTIHITALTQLELKSGKAAKTFRTPTCLELYKNLTICVPSEVRGVYIKVIHKMGNIFDVNVTWDKPELLPDNYTVELFPLSTESTKLFIHNVSGTAINTLFSDVSILDEYEVAVGASSICGKGPTIVYKETILQKDMTLSEISPASKLGNIFMILTGSLGLVFGSSAYIYHWRRKRLLRPLRFKDSEIDVTKDIGEPEPIVIGVKEVQKPVDEYEIRPDCLEIEELLGSGAFGIVKFGRLRDDRGQVTIVAVKMLRDDPSEEDQRGFELEMKMMKSAGQHRNIVSLLGCCTIGPRPYLVVEYCSQGDLQTFLRTILAKATVWVSETKKQCVLGMNLAKNVDRGNDDNMRVSSSVANCAYDVDRESVSDSGIVTVMDLLNFGRQVATGMEFLSSNRVVHRDLAARNVLVCHDRTVKISDFGLSRDIYQENVYKKQSSGRLPIKWMAIEALTHQVYSTYSDVWSFGILLWEIVTLGSSPYPEIPANEVLNRLKLGYRMERPANCSLPLYNVMLSCWQAKPKDRPTFTILREKLDKLLCAAGENDYVDLNDEPKETPPEGEDSHLSSQSYSYLPLQLTYVNDLDELRAARQDHNE